MRRDEELCVCVCVCVSDALKERDVGHKWVSGTGGREKNGEQSRTVASYSKQPQSYMIVLLHVHACNNHKPHV